MTLTDWSRTILFRATAISLAGLMAFNATANGLEMLGIFAAESGQKIARKFVGHYTDKPTRVYLGEAPGRDPHRDNWWTARQRADYSRAKLNKLFSQAIEDGNVLASTVPAAVASFAMLQGGSGGSNGGGSTPGEGDGPGGGSGGTGGGGGPRPGEPNGGLGGESNTNTGNKLSTLPIVSWGSLGDSGVSFNLYHSSRTDWNETLGHGWSHSYEAEITYTSGSSAILRMPDGLLVPYTEASGVFTPPPGWNHDLVKNSGGSFTLTFKDQKKMEFNSSGQLTQVKDRNGNATNITRNGSGQITLIESADGRDLTLTYNGSGRVSTITDPLSRVWTLAYNASSQLTGVTYPTLNSTSHTRSFTYNAAHDILTETDLRGKVWTWTYDSEGKMTAFSNPLSQTTSYSYSSSATTITFPDTTTRVDNYSSGLLASRVDEASFSSAFVYDTDRNITRLTDKRGKEWTATYDSKGNVLTRTNPLNKTWTYTCSSLNDLLTAENPKGEDTIYTRDGSGRVTLIDDGLGRDSVRYTYDSFGQVLTAKDALNRTTTYSYNSKGELTSTTDPGSVTTTLAYDNLSRVTSITDAALNTTTLTYDAWGRAITVTHPDSSAAAVTYNNEGQVLSSQDEEGRVSSWTYDDAGRQTSFTNGRSDTETYAYNSVDLLTSVTNGRGKTRTYTYTSRGEVASLTMPDGTEEDWTYNGEGQETSYTNGLGQVNSYTYDDAGQSTGVDYPSGTDTSFTYDDAGRVTAMVDGTGTTTWVYDAAGQISSLAQPQGTLTYTYNLAGQRTAQSGASQSQSWTFNSSTGRLTSTSNGFGEDTTFTYDSLGRLATKTFEGNNYEVYTYDSRGRLTNIKHRRPNTDILREYTYTYDDSGKVLTYRVGTLTTTYAYDGAGQLTSESRTGYSATYSYDANGNRLTRTVGGTTENYAYDDGDKLQDVKVGGTAIKTFGYDAAGRTTSVTTSAGTTTIGYDFESRATSISGPGISQSNTYNGLDTRVSSTTNSVSNTFLRDGAYVTDPVVKDSNATYTPGLYERRAGSTRQLHHNLKNVELQTTLTPAVSASRTYDAFGNVLSSTGTHRGPFGNGGGFGYQEDATGLKLLGHRLYDSSTGRFLTRDPIKEGRNWYVYCDNDPVGFGDSEGLIRRRIGKWIADGIGRLITRLLPKPKVSPIVEASGPKWPSKPIVRAGLPKISRQKQNKHVKGTKEHAQTTEPKSVFASKEKADYFVEEAYKRGTLIRDKDGQKIIDFVFDEVVGVDYRGRPQGKVRVHVGKDHMHGHPAGGVPDWFIGPVP
jgi:RHS repeat-associated protein